MKTLEDAATNIRPIDGTHRDAVNDILAREWHCPPSVAHGKAVDTTWLPGFVWVSGEEIQGVITYHIEGDACEIVTLNSFQESRGIGTALINAVAAAAREKGCTRLWLITTNDDTDAIRFYQIKGFEWVAMHRDAMDVSRRIKPAIPLIGMHGIPIRHELEFEMRL